MEEKMKKLMKEQWIAILSLLFGIILSVTGYAYGRDVAKLEESISDEKKERKEDVVKLKILINENDVKLKISIIDKMESHEKLHDEQAKQGIMLIKYLDQRFDDMEKLINKHN